MEYYAVKHKSSEAYVATDGELMKFGDKGSAMFYIEQMCKQYEYLNSDMFEVVLSKDIVFEKEEFSEEE